MRAGAAGQPVRAKTGMNISEGDTIKTAVESRCEISFDATYVVRCDEKAVLIINLVKLQKANLSSPIGKLWVNVKHLVKRNDISVTSPTATAAIRGTVFSISSDSVGIRYAVYRGEVAVTPQDTTQSVPSPFSVKTDNELVLIKNFDQYLQVQKALFEQYQNKQESDFEQFQKEQQRGVDSLLNRQDASIKKRLDDERLRFKVLGSYHYAMEPIDNKNQSDWILWNKKCDTKLGW